VRGLSSPGPRNGRWRGGPQTLTCVGCARPFTVDGVAKVKRGAKFCSRKCYWQSKRAGAYSVTTFKPLSEHPLWREDPVSRRAAGRRARQLFPGKKRCERCGTEEQVQRHHKNENPWDNRAENIAWLCIRCHAAHHAQAKHARQVA